MTACAQCGADNSPTAAFCTRCNQYLWSDDHSSRPANQTNTPVPQPAAQPTRPAAESVEPRAQPVKPAEPAATPMAPDAAPTELPATAAHQDLQAAIEAGKVIAGSRGRTDLEEHLERAQDHLDAQLIPVVVVGEFKQGKSTLINALLQTDVCAVDADIVTAVPTTVRYSVDPIVTRYQMSPDGEHLQEERMPLESLHRLEADRSDLHLAGQQRMVEVGLAHPMLKTGMALVDTPGVGGLDSADGQLALGALAHAEGVMFVSDPAQELTGPEMTFLRKAAERCSRIALVMPKIDLYPRWRQIAALNEGHLKRAGLDVPVITVSSFLRLRAKTSRGEARRELDAESRFAELVTFLARDVVVATRQEAARSVAVEVDFVAGQLEQQAHMERAVIATPGKAAEVVAELEVVQRQARRLAAPTATWQLTLGDGIAKLESDVDYDLQARLRRILHEAEAEIDEVDPRDAWDDIEAWLRRELAIASVANRDLMLGRAEDLAIDVAEQFELPSGSGVVLDLGTGGDAIEEIALSPASSFAVLSSRLAPVLMAARTGYLPLALGGAVVGAGITVLGLPGAVAVLGLSALLGGGIGVKIFGGEMQRQRVARQQAAKVAVRKFVDEVSFTVGKQTRDALRATRQQLRDDFQGRAKQLERSARETAVSVTQASRMDSAQLRERDRQLASQERRLRQVRQAAHVAGTGES
jgi:hypothetical protein